MLSEHDRAILNKFVTPFYLKLTGLFSGEKHSETDREARLNEFTKVAGELDEPTAHSLLENGNWRHHRTISWMVGFREWRHFAEQLEQIQARSIAKAQPGLSVGLVMLGQTSSAPVLSAYLDTALQSGRHSEQPGWAMAALIELDKLHGTEFANPYLADGGLWQQYADRPTRQLAPVAEIVSALASYRTT